MADLVSWRPKTENTLRKKWAEKRKQYKQQLEEESTVAEEGAEQSTSSNQNFTKSAGLEKPGIGPRVFFYLKKIVKCSGENQRTRRNGRGRGLTGAGGKS